MDIVERIVVHHNRARSPGIGAEKSENMFGGSMVSINSCALALLQYFSTSSSLLILLVSTPASSSSQIRRLTLPIS